MDSELCADESASPVLVPVVVAVVVVSIPLPEVDASQNR